MGAISQQADNSCAAVISFFAIHHVDFHSLQRCLGEWRRVLVLGGQLLLAAWEGTGPIDYGDISNVVARRYPESEVIDEIQSAGFEVASHSVISVEGFDMDAIHVLASKQ